MTFARRPHLKEGGVYPDTFVASFRVHLTVVKSQAKGGRVVNLTPEYRIP
jgi:glycerol-3-phosphate dehydrogenase